MRKHDSFEYLAGRKIACEAAGGLCVKCGRTMEEVHHVYGRSDNRPEHLRPLCYLCHGVAPDGDAYWRWEMAGEAGPESFMRRLKEQRGYGPEADEVVRVAMDIFIEFRLVGRREDRHERTSEAMQAKRRRGEQAGTVPYGFQVVEGGKLMPNEPEMGIVARIRGLRLIGESFRQIADTLNAAGFKTRRGTPWRFQYVANILKHSRGAVAG